MTNILKVINTYDEPFDCEDCGLCFPEGCYVEYNGEKIWERYSDGHYSGHETEDSLLNTILAKWLQEQYKKFEIQFSEEKRHEWNENHPGNGIATTIENWLKQKISYIEFANDTVEVMKTNCENLPSKEHLKAKIIAAWFEAEASEMFEVQVSTQRYEGKDIVEYSSDDDTDD